VGEVFEQYRGDMRRSARAADAYRIWPGRAFASAISPSPISPERTDARRGCSARPRARDRLKIAHDVVRQFFVQRLVDRMRADAAYRQRVAVGRRVGRNLRRNDAAGAAAIVHDDLLAECVAERPAMSREARST